MDMTNKADGLNHTDLAGEAGRAADADGLWRYTLLDGQARATLANTTALCQAAKEIHGLSRVAAAALGRLLTATVIMAADLKGSGDSLTTRVDGDGPLGMLLAVGRPGGVVKGYVDNPQVDLPRVNGKLPVGAAVGKRGTLTVIRDLGLKEPYVGRVHLVSGELGEDFALYFTASEQTPSLVSLGVLTSETVEAAGGLIVSLMPGADEEAVKTLEACSGRFSGISGTLKELGLEKTAEKLFEGLSPRRLDTLTPRYACDCSRARVERALISLGKEELEQMIREDHGARVTCHFCNREQAFTQAELEALLACATRREA